MVRNLLFLSRMMNSVSVRMMVEIFAGWKKEIVKFDLKEVAEALWCRLSYVNVMEL